MAEGLAAARQSSNYRKHTSGSRLRRALIARFHETIAERLDCVAPETFLDAGCGEGFVTKMLLDRLPGLRVTGCDLSPRAVRLAVAQNPSAGFAVANLFALPFLDESYDAVGCFEVLEHLPGDGPERALREMARVARRAVVLSVPHEPFFSKANAACGKNLGVRPMGSDPDHRQFWSRRGFGDFVGGTMDVVWLGGSFPWTVCVAQPRR